MFQIQQKYYCAYKEDLIKEQNLFNDVVLPVQGFGV